MFGYRGTTVIVFLSLSFLVFIERKKKMISIPIRLPSIPLSGHSDIESSKKHDSKTASRHLLPYIKSYLNCKKQIMHGNIAPNFQNAQVCFKVSKLQCNSHQISILKSDRTPTRKRKLKITHDGSNVQTT